MSEHKPLDPDVERGLVALWGMANASRFRFIQYLFFTNAGGAVASLSFLGARGSDGAAAKLILLPLSCFVAGVVLAGLTALSNWIGDAIQYRSDRKRLMNVPADFGDLSALVHNFVPIPFRRLVGADKAFEWAARMHQWAVPWSFWLFVLGCVIGLVMLFFG